MQVLAKNCGSEWKSRSKERNEGGGEKVREKAQSMWDLRVSAQKPEVTDEEQNMKEKDEN